ncbi:hypothetical protein R6Q59_034416 [Mikania micrantha]
METYGNVFDEEWVNLESVFFYDQDSNHVTCHELMFLNEHDHHGLSLETPVPVSSANESFSSSSCAIDDQILAYSDHQESNNFMFLAQVFSDDVMEEIHCLKQDEVVVEKGKMENSVISLKRKYFEEGNTLKTDKKKASNDHNKNKKKLPPKKIQKMMTSVNENEDDGELMTHQKNAKNCHKMNGRGSVQTSSSCSSEDESNASHGRQGSTEKTRAGRGAATDPQSIYARKRRERINERLRILQNLVPNGTKVDISTMLEEAVHYVKFLQLQINLLSSDDKWMYAPIAYNGVDMGLYKTL